MARQGHSLTCEVCNNQLAVTKVGGVLVCSQECYEKMRKWNCRAFARRSETDATDYKSFKLIDANLQHHALAQYEAAKRQRANLLDDFLNSGDSQPEQAATHWETSSTKGMPR